METPEFIFDCCTYSKLNRRNNVADPFLFPFNLANEAANKIEVYIHVFLYLGKGSLVIMDERICTFAFIHIFKRKILK